MPYPTGAVAPPPVSGIPLVPPAQEGKARMVGQSHDEGGGLAAASGQTTERYEEIQRALSAYSSEFLLFVTRDGTITYGSEDDVLGYPSASLGTHVGEVLHADDLPRVFELIEQARGESGYRDRIQVRARHADGSWRLLDAAVFEVGNDEVLGTGAVLRVRDITD